MKMKNILGKLLIMTIIISGVFVYSLDNAFAASLNITTKYTQTGGIKGPLNNVGDLVNDVNICPADPTDGCDFANDPGYSNNGTTSDPSDDTYSGDLIVRTKMYLRYQLVGVGMVCKMVQRKRLL